MKKERVISSTILALLTVLLLVTILTVPRIVRDSVFEGRDTRCAIQLGRYDDTTRGLITGYNYHLLKTLAADEDIDIDIILARRGDDYTDYFPQPRRTPPCSRCTWTAWYGGSCGTTTRKDSRRWNAG